jgi:hypothetical protein
MAQKVDPREEFHLAHNLVGLLMTFPPFSIDQDMRKQFQSESVEAIEGLIESNASDSEWNSVHNPLMEKYATELEEASLWNARSGGNTEEAKKLALALEGKTPEEIKTYLFLS